jgi:hypothetical protein
MNSPSFGEKWLKPKEKTHLIQSYVAFIYQLYTQKFLAIYTCFGAFDVSIWCISKKMQWFFYFVIIDMSPIPSFAHINWIELKILKFWNLDFITSFFIHDIWIWIIVLSCHMNIWHFISQCKFQNLIQNNYLRYQSGKRKCNLILHENPKVVG